MEYRTLGRTNESVSLVGMGTGGHDPLGLKSGRPEAEMVTLLHRAFDLGINLFDTSPGYGSGRSETILGRALQALPREDLLVSTKIPLAGSMGGEPAKLMKAADVGPAVDESLQRLQLDHVDIMLIAVADQPEYYDTVVDNLIPELQKQKELGKIRFIGSSEQTRSDGAHSWLQRVLSADVVDVVMVGHNMINQSARRVIFPTCSADNIGVVNIFTIRNLFWNPTRLKEVLDDLVRRQLLAPDETGDHPGLDWLLEEAACETLVEAAYRYAAYTKPVSTVMCGTIKIEELEENIPGIEKGPLPTAAIERLHRTFGHIAEAIGN
jgi:L-galactose dehydrogenase